MVFHRVSRYVPLLSCPLVLLRVGPRALPVFERLCEKKMKSQSAEVASDGPSTDIDLLVNALLPLSKFLSFP